MSHFKEREQKNCLNCNAVVQGRFCHICGQENIEPKESFWHLVSHFFQDITHFDGKFFSSLKLLIFKPGFLSREYMVGRRASYLNPIRMYVFASALFFLIFFSLFHMDADKSIVTSGDVNNVPISTIATMDSVSYKKFVDTLVKNDSTLKFAYDKQQYFKYLDSLAAAAMTFHFTPTRYHTQKEYDSALAHGKDHNWFEQRLVRKQIEIDEKYKGDSKAASAALVNNLLHSLPQLLFVSLPLFALLLNILYSRRKQFYYTNHAIFTIHFFVFLFIALLFIFGFNKLKHFSGFHWAEYLSVVMILLIFFYNYKAMRNFYQQGRGKTILKFILLHLINIIIVAILFVVFTFLSLFKI
ncbi:DUF3667 domain-containing protein [Ferruginibacter sp. SUN106]|uniref:DUF3667 domain-containing protein n=1 Tax=Ferruginibacter sp. SUN106 TaxID=2978348 RepID=UPI003D36639D